MVSPDRQNRLVSTPGSSSSNAGPDPNPDPNPDPDPGFSPDSRTNPRSVADPESGTRSQVGRSLPAKKGLLIEFGGLPGTGKSTLAGRLAVRLGAVLMRIDEIESAMRRQGLTAQQTGIAVYAIAHDVAGSHLRRGLVVIADAVSPVEAARAGWRDLARDCSAGHKVIETRVTDPAEHRRRVEQRLAPDAVSDLPGWVYPGWPDVSRREYEPRTDDRLVVDTQRPIEDCEQDIFEHLAIGP